MGDTPPREPTGQEAQRILKAALAAGHLTDAFVEEKLGEMRGETGDEVRAAGRVKDTDDGKGEGKDEKELSPEQVWFGQFKTRFDALPQLHEGVPWAEVEKSLIADPESMRKLQALDEKGHNMNVFGEEKGEFVFVSGWDNYEQVAADHRNVVFDKVAQDYLAEHYPDKKCNGNATDIVKALGVDLADTKFHEQLRREIVVNGLAWLKTDAATRKTGDAFIGSDYGVGEAYAYNPNDNGSFRVELRVKTVQSLAA